MGKYKKLDKKQIKKKKNYLLMSFKIKKKKLNVAFKVIEKVVRLLRGIEKINI